MRLPSIAPDDLPATDDDFRFPLAGVPVPLEWSKRAACAPGDRQGKALVAHVESYFPAEDTSARAGIVTRCERCCVRAECLAFGMAYPVKGVWGGLTEAQRTTIKRRRTRARRARQRLLRGAA